ncbi:MAG: DMT family transporter [Methanomassiliicoccales archaeon]
MPNEMRRAYLALLIGVFFFSFSSILIRYSDAPAPAIAAYRMLFAALILAPFAFLVPRARKETLELKRGDALFMAAIGIVLAFHFLFFVSAVQMTSVASATILINAHPIFVAILAFAALHEGSRWTTLGAIIGVLGILVISISDLGYGTNSLGDMLAVAGALLEAVYIIMTRFMRRKVGILTFVFVVNSVCALTLIALCVAGGVPLWPYSQNQLLVFLAMAIIPAVLGYTLYNYSMRWIIAPRVSVIQLLEALFASIMAAFLFAEYPDALIYVGAALIFIGIYLAVRSNKKQVTMSSGGGSTPGPER